MTLDESKGTVRAYDRTALGRIDAAFLSAPIPRTVLITLLAATLIVPAVQFVHRIQKTQPSPYRADGLRHETALGRWLPTAELLTQSDPAESPYRYGHWFPLPPLILIGVHLLCDLGYAGAAIVWAALKLIGIVVAMVLLLRSIAFDERPVPFGVIVLGFVFGVRAIVADMQHGNVNTFVLVWIAIAWSLYVRRRDMLAGIFVAAAIVTKVTPALLLVYFIYKRAWRSGLGAAIGLLLFLVVIPGVHLGFARNLDYLQDWFHMLIVPYTAHGYAALDIDNQSIYGVMVRLANGVGWPPVEHMPLAERAFAGVEHMARLSGFSGRVIRAAIGLSVVATLAWVCRRPFPTRGHPRALLELCLVLLAMLLLSERTWKHHATTLAIVFMAYWYTLTCVSFSPRFRRWAVAGLAVQWFLLVGSSEGLLGDGAADALLMAGGFCWGLVICFLQTVCTLAALSNQPAVPRGRRTADPRQAGAPSLM